MKIFYFSGKLKEKKKFMKEIVQDMLNFITKISLTFIRTSKLESNNA